MTSEVPTVIVTGANGGIGYECVRALIIKGSFRVIMACRNIESANEAARTLREKSQKDVLLEVMELDLASLASVRSFVSLVNSRLSEGVFGPLHTLVCNAGVAPMASTPRKTKDGYETGFQVNHLAHLDLLLGLIPVMTKSSRIIIVASGVHDPTVKTGVPPARIRPLSALLDPFSDPAWAADRPEDFPGRIYATTKLCNVLTAYELARRLRQKGSTISVYALEPGFVPGTELFGRHLSGFGRWLWKSVAPNLLWLIHLLVTHNARTVKEAGENMAQLVLDESLPAPSGSYFEFDKPIRSSLESYDETLQQELFEMSTKLLGVQLEL